MKWISVKDRLPEHRQKVLIYDTHREHWESGTGVQVAVFWLGEHYKEGNDKTPYTWYADGGPMHWFGQYVTHWAHLPDPPK